MKGASDGGVTVDPPIDGHTEIPAHLVVWAAGSNPVPVVERSGAKLGQQKGLVVDACCRLSGYSDIWALGDCAEVPKGGDGKTYGPTAQNAVREGKLVAENIRAVLAGGQPKPFRYKPMGELAIVGRRAGVGTLYGLRVSGLPAWLMWRAVYLGKMPTMMKRLRVASTWLTDLIFGRDDVELTATER